MPPVKVFSSTVAKTCENPRTLLEKLYQRSDRTQYSGSTLLASWPRSATLIVACVASVRVVERVPRMLVMNGQLASVSIAEPVPRKPPPARK